MHLINSNELMIKRSLVSAYLFNYNAIKIWHKSLKFTEPDEFSNVTVYYERYLVVSNIRSMFNFNFETKTIKVSKFQNEYMKSSDCPKYKLTKKIEKFSLKFRAELFKFFRSYFGQSDDFMYFF